METDKDTFIKDFLTGLNSREELFYDLKKGNNYILAIVNIDKFSEINNSYGEIIGNIVLKEVGKRLNTYSNKAKVYRCYGDEYALLISYKNQTKKEIIDFFETLAKNISKNKLVEDIYIDHIHIGVTIGVSFGKRDLYVNSNVAFQVAKNQHKHVIVYDESYSDIKEFNNNHNIQEHIAKAAITQGEIISYYQPIFSNEENRIVKYEALARLSYQNRILYPNEFIEAAKRAKVYTEITMSMIDKVFKDFKYRDEKVSINIATEDIFNNEIVNRIEKALSEYNNSQNIVFEITESGKIQCFSTLQNFIERIKKHGAQISIDDFGTEYSNLTHLSQLKTDYLKIDGQFIKNCHEHSRNYIILEAISQMAKKLNIKTVAEYVESEEILNVVQVLGITYSQGHLFGKAEPIEKIRV